MMKTAFLLAIILAVTAIPLHGGDALRVAVTPVYAFAPANLHVRVKIEPSADNRTLEIVADAESFYRSSEMDLQGDRAPKTMEFNFRNVPGGAYRISAVVKGQGGRQRAMAVQLVNIMSIMDPEQGQN
jgi:hypothetical protein